MLFQFVCPTQQAEIFWVQLIQRHHYAKEYQALQCGKETELVKKLGLILDKD